MESTPPPTLLELPTLVVHGSPTQMGEAQGEALRPLVRALVEARFAAVAQYCRERGLPDADRLVAVGAESFATLAAWDPEGYAEHVGVARGAGLDPLELYTATQMTDLRDVLTLGADEPEGCSSIVLPPGFTADGAVLAGQTWDLNPTDVDFVVAIKRMPTDGPATWSVTCAGCPSLMGINAHGLAVGTTNIKTRFNRADGVGYLALIHRALRAPDAASAAALIREAPRVAAHTFWLADAQTTLQLETSTHHVETRHLVETPWVHTNHCVAPALVAIAGEAPSESSLARRRFLNTEVARGGHTVASLQAAFADRSLGVLSVNRYPEDLQGTTTNAVFIARPAQQTAWACRGPADRGRFIQLDFA